MPPFKRPKSFVYNFKKDEEIKAIKKLQQRKVPFGISRPDRNKNQLLIGSWNIANFDVQERTNACYDLIAEIIRPFDLVAIQEINASMTGLNKIMKILERTHTCIFSDTGGNKERMTYIYKPRRIKLLNHIGELTIPPSNRKSLKFDGKSVKFRGYDRPSYVASWKFKSTTFTTYNSHIYYGKSSTQGGNPDIIAEAQQSLAEGDSLREAGEYKDAVNKYKDALAKAESIIVREMAVQSLAQATAQQGDSELVNSSQQDLDDGDSLRDAQQYKDAVDKYKDSHRKAEVSTTPVADLYNEVESLVIPKGKKKSLQANLIGAAFQLNKDPPNTNAAINKLNAFINKVEAQRGAALTNDEVDTLIQMAEDVIASIQ